MVGSIRNKVQIKNMDKMTVFWSACGLIFIAIFLISFYAPRPPRDKLKLTIDYGDGTARNFMTDYKNDVTAWDMLQQASAIYAIPLAIENHFTPKAIGDKENGESGRKWNFYLNGRKAEEPYKSVLPSGALVLFRFE